MKVMVVFGTRPEAIKLAPVICELRKHRDRLDVRVCVTAQHRQMLDQMLDLFGILPDIDFDLMVPGQTPSQIIARVLGCMEPVLRAERPDWVIVQGDTSTVMATAMAAYHERVPVAHVEAGLRTRDRSNPFPEEMNRFVVDYLSDLHFAPTSRARLNLLHDGIEDRSIQITGNTVIDALLEVACRSWTPPATDPLASLPTNGADPRAGDLPRLILVTAHRRENFGRAVHDICLALRELAEARRDELHVVFPVHPNPEVQEPVRGLLGGVPNITLLAPLDYQSLVYVLKRCYLVLTDSGGLQEESPALGKPVLVLRSTTERPEAVEAGVARVVGTDPRDVVRETNRLLDDPVVYASMISATNPFGDGHAAERIVARLLGTSAGHAPGSSETHAKTFCVDSAPRILV